jgi:hypothetical protein
MFREHSRVQKELESMRRSQRELQDQIRALDISLTADRYTKKLPMYEVCPDNFRTIAR